MRGLSVALPGATHDALAGHLLRADHQEDVCFALYRTSTGAHRDSCLLREVILPRDGERHVHGNASFTSEYFLRAADAAEEAGAGLALLHSHPGGAGWQGMSGDDIVAEQRYAAQTQALTGLPLLGCTLAGDEGWSARRWERDGTAHALRESATVRVVGEAVRITHHPELSPAVVHDERMLRTVSAWGERIQQDISRQHVGIVGAGSVGALVAEAVARTGVRRITLIDFDTVAAHNLDRLAHATRLDAHLHRAKVRRLCQTCERYGTARAAQIEPLELSVVEPDGYAAALDCDVLFSCVDRPWPRQLLDHVAFAHMVPVIDGGLAIRASEQLTSADWKAHVACPGRACLECLGQYRASDVALERAGDLDDPTYIRGLPRDHPLRTNENVYAFSQACASLEVLQWLSMTVAPLDIGDVGAWNFHFVTGAMDVAHPGCRQRCPQAGQTGNGDSASPGAPVAHHPAAEQMRVLRKRAQSGAMARALLGLQDGAHRAAEYGPEIFTRLSRRSRRR
jgi:molybdopterin-synthase adenylyltransferase